MLPTLVSGQYLLVSRLAYLLDPPRRGDVVVLHDPGQPGVECIKRIIGLPGERLELQDGQVFLDGRPLKEPYLAAESPGSSAANNAKERHDGVPGWREWSLGDDWYFVMGDRRGDSRDSRTFGPVPGALIIGRAWVRYWPRGAWGVFRS
jgi:signal peptidase I